MKNIPMPIYQLALLQAYLYEVFTYENHCKNSFDNSEWYLGDKYNKEEVNSIFDFFRSKDINCDCDIINKFDIREFSKDMAEYHH